MLKQVYNRSLLVEALRKELVGPAPCGRELDISRPVVFTDSESSYGPWKEAGTGEEIISRERPQTRYALGVLFPFHMPKPGQDSKQTEFDFGSDEVDEHGYVDVRDDMVGDPLLTEEAETLIQNIAGRPMPEEDGTSDAIEHAMNLLNVNTNRPSSMGLTFLAHVTKDASLTVEVSGGRYRMISVRREERDLQWWVRSPVSLLCEFSGRSICEQGGVLTPEARVPENANELDLRVEVVSRPWRDPQTYILTVYVTNRTDTGFREDERCLFQSRFEMTLTSPAGRAEILPYPGPAYNKPDMEEQSMALLYREFQTYAIGHGCSADWQIDPLTSVPQCLIAECLPACEIPSITPDIKDAAGRDIEVSMAELAGLVPGSDGIEALTDIVSLYRDWIAERCAEIPALDSKLQNAARRHMEIATSCAKRMEGGLSYLHEDPRAMRAFRLANHAMLLQQICSRHAVRLAQFEPMGNRTVFSSPYTAPDPMHPPVGRGKWRAFQVAFLLMSMRSAAEGADPDRDVVELIWFPTGGGKTESYLALTAFCIFMRRLKDQADAGVETIMRYTLRLLTAQQFQRACGLICSMEYLRRRNAEALGGDPITIGIWLGSSVTPNTRSDALAALTALRSRPKENRFLVMSCPWCGAQMGPVRYRGPAARNAPTVLGYERGVVAGQDTVIFKCNDSACEFHDRLPIYVIDQDIYAARPSLLIGTVDKFAALTWNPDTRSLFGLDRNGTRIFSPPGLIIQDELHLISGPLGSMVALYESLVEELCTDRRNGLEVKPKLVCSTATMRRYAEQVRALYARTSSMLFPPPGLHAGDSFFARYARDANGHLAPGRLYLGVHAQSLGSLQEAQVRTFSAILQAPMELPEDERDPWWTLLAYHNSLKELGGTLSMFQSYVGIYTKALISRTGRRREDIRHISNIVELTGRMKNEEVPLSLTALEARYPNVFGQAYPVDVCLASNIMEVGVDIDRLSLISIVAQPKATSQYIQVTGRIGRRWWERPGLVVTIYAAARPRDRSHFERFRSYHERLYAQVEATSVTPFSQPALERGLHAIMAAYVRQMGDITSTRSPYPCPLLMLEHLRSLLRDRVVTVDPTELSTLERTFNRRIEEWQRWERTVWESPRDGSEIGLLRDAGAYVSPARRHVSWPTSRSLRDVDAQSEAEITLMYLEHAVDSEAHEITPGVEGRGTADES